jgi:hypothetical protein
VKWVSEERDAYLLGLVRALLGVLLCHQAWQRWDELAHWGYFGSYFHLPFLPEAWVPSASGYRALLGIELFGGALAVLGKRGREGLLLASCVGIYLLLCDRLQYHNNRFTLFLFGLVTAFCPSDRSFLLFRGRNHALPLAERLGPTLPRRLLAYQVSLLYLSSGGGKALDPDWRSGQTMLLRFQGAIEELTQRGDPPPRWLAELMSAPWYGELASKAAISLELGLVVALWIPRTRVLALWAGALFHVGIQLSARVELFSFAMGVAYIAFVTPEIRERRLLVDPKRPLGRLAGRLVPWLDWLARFQVEAHAAGSGGGPAVIAIDRDGRKATGLGAAALLCRALPAFFLVWPLVAGAERFGNRNWARRPAHG